MPCPRPIAVPQCRCCFLDKQADSVAAERSRAHVRLVRRETVPLSRALNVLRLAKAALRVQH